MISTTMRKLILVSAITILGAVGSAQAQKPVDLIGPPIQFDQSLNIEDDGNGSFLQFDTGSGKYKFTRCNDGYTISGAGSIRVDGCSIHLESLQSDHRVVVSVNECDQQAKGVVEKFISFDGTAPFKAFLNDKNMGNNLMDCASKK